MRLESSALWQSIVSEYGETWLGPSLSFWLRLLNPEALTNPYSEGV